MDLEQDHGDRGRGTALRFGAIGEFAGGSPAAPAEDAGEIDGDGRIAALYTFPGPLPAV